MISGQIWRYEMSIVKDTSTILKIVATIVTMFNMNSHQETTLKNYVKSEQAQWIEKCKDEAEVQAYIIGKANEIMKE